MSVVERTRSSAGEGTEGKEGPRGPGAQWKAPVRLATTGALLNSPTGSKTGTLTATTNGALKLDTVNVVAGNRILVKNQAEKADNGIYVVVKPGGTLAKWEITRASDALTGAELEGATVDVLEGETLKQMMWTCVTTTITVNTTLLVWEPEIVTLLGLQTITGTKTFPGTVGGASTGSIQNFANIFGAYIKAEKKFKLNLHAPITAAGEYSPFINTTQVPVKVLNLEGSLILNGWRQTGGNEEGELIVVVNENVVGYTITLTNEKAVGETGAGEIFKCPGGRDVILQPFNSVFLLKTGTGWAFIGEVLTFSATLPTPSGVDNTVVVGSIGNLRKQTASYTGDAVSTKIVIKHKLETAAITVSMQTDKEAKPYEVILVEKVIALNTSEVEVTLAFARAKGEVVWITISG